jgi:hypothetical protein
LNSEFFRALILELSIHQSGSGFVADPLQLFTFSSKMAGMLGIQFVDRIRLRKLFRCKNCGIVFSFAKPLWYRKVRQATRYFGARAMTTRLISVVPSATVTQGKQGALSGLQPKETKCRRLFLQVPL